VTVIPDAAIARTVIPDAAIAAMVRDPMHFSLSLGRGSVAV